MSETRVPRLRRAVSARTVLAVAGLGVFMAFLDGTIVSIAFPDMLESFPDSSLSDLSWVFNVYNVALAALLIPAGRIADIAGRRRLFVTGVVLFTVASVLCASAPSVAYLVAARAVQGVGAAIIIPTSLGLILSAAAGGQRTQAIALWSAVGALAAGIGPSIGGLLVTLASWRLVFLINLPIGILVLWLSRRHLVESRAPGRRAMPDMWGAVLVAVAIGMLTLAIVQGPTWGWVDLRTAGAVGVAVAASVAVLRRSRWHPSPVVDSELMHSPGVLGANLLTLVGSAGFFALGLANILYLMEVWGYSALVAGLAGTPAPFVAAVTAALMGKVVAERDPRPFIVLGGAIWAAGPLILAAGFSTEPHYLTSYLPGAIVLAVGIGVTFPLVGAIAVANASGGRYAGAAALNSSVRQFGAALGVAVLVVLVGQPGPAEVEGSFNRAWWFATACFVVVGLGGLALGRPDPVVPAESLATGQGEGRGPESPAASESPTRAAGPSAPPEVPTSAVAPRTAAECLATVPMFAQLPVDTLDAVAGRTSVVSLAAGEWLYRQGDVADALYVVQAGRLQVVDEAAGSGPVILRELGAGSTLGELALICDSRRTASVRVRRDARLLRVGRDDYEAILAESPAFARTMLRTVGEWLATGMPSPEEQSAAPTTIAVVALGESAAAAGLDRELGQRLSELVSALLVTDDIVPEGTSPGVALSALLDRAEEQRQTVLLMGGSAGSGEWTQSCLRQADRVLLVVDDVPDQELLARWQLPRGADVVLLGRSVDAGTARMLDRLEPRATHRVRADGHRAGDVRVMARRLAGRAVGLVLSGGGARSFTQIGVIEELHDAGVVIDRVGGTSMGAFIGALLAQGLAPEEVDARCYEEWVRRNPVGDFRFPPRTSLIRGRRARAMLERNLPGTIEELPLSFFATSVDLISARPIHLRRGPLLPAVGSSMALPIFMEPVVHDGMLLLDGGLMDNLPSEAMAGQGEGPVIAVDVSEPSVRSLEPGVQPEVPGLVETLYKVMLLSESDDARRRSFADLYIRPDFTGTGILEFHMLDEMRQEGRRAARRALASAPSTIFA